ncbi:MAG: TetR family transcriptional regulator [Rhodothermaceae bacterium]
MRRTKEEAEKTRQDILKAAIEVFSEKGFASSTLVDIAKKANVTRGAIYWHFNNKNDLFEALIAENDSKVNQMIENIRAVENSPIVALQLGLTQSLKKLDEDPEYRAIEQLLVKSKFAGEIDFLTQKMSKNDHEGFKIMKEIFEKYKEQCNCTEFNISTAIKVVGAFFYGAMILKLSEQSDSPFYIGDDVEDFVAQFFRGIKQ